MEKERPENEPKPAMASVGTCPATMTKAVAAAIIISLPFTLLSMSLIVHLPPMRHEHRMNFHAVKRGEGSMKV